MRTVNLIYTHIETGEKVEVIKVYRDLGIRYIVFWKDDSEPTVYKPSDFMVKFN